MRTAILTLFLLSVGHSTVLAGCACPPEIDWERLENLALTFASQPGPETAGPFLAAFPAADRIALPPASPALEQAVAKIRAVALASIDDSTPWALQLGLRFLRLSDRSFEPEISAKISGLATTAPRFFLHQLARFSEDNPCVVDLLGIVSVFGPGEKIEAGADPSGEDVAARIEALASVEDAELRQLRDWCLERLEVLRERRWETPRVLRRVRVDLSPLRDRHLRSPFVIAEATVGTEGKVKAVKILRSADPEVDKAVVEALRQWLFEPKLEEGQPVEFTYVQSVSWHPQ